MTANNIKRWLCMYLLREKGFQCAMPETGFGHGVCDVFAINRAGYTHEYEIKVTKQDLMGEMRNIFSCREVLKDKSRTWTEKDLAPRAGKLFKHQLYMVSGLTVQYPAYFWFVVPPTLVDVAKQHLEGTAYGLISVTTVERYDQAAFPVFRIEKPAERRHKIKFTEFGKMLRRACFKIYP